MFIDRSYCKDTPFTFSDKERGAFNTLKTAFTKAPVLQYPDQDCEFWLETNASKFGVGGVLSVKGDDSDFQPVAYMSHSMTPPECNYSIYDKEMLAMIKVVLSAGGTTWKSCLMLSRFTQIIITWSTLWGHRIFLRDRLVGRFGCHDLIFISLPKRHCHACCQSNKQALWSLCSQFRVQQGASFPSTWINE